MYELLDGQEECACCAHEKWIGQACEFCGYEEEEDEDYEEGCE